VIGPIVGVGAIVVEHGALLLVRRGHPPAAGHWTIPGGRVERGEELRAAVAREVREETALDVEVGAFAGWVERFDEDHHFVILDFFAAPAPTGQPLQAADDATDARWVPLEQVADYRLAGGLLMFLREVGTVPA
jgi:ADP-ribose pyrophosphatase YjhB (NUDIX family)